MCSIQKKKMLYFKIHGIVSSIPLYMRAVLLTRAVRGFQTRPLSNKLKSRPSTGEENPVDSTLSKLSSFYDRSGHQRWSKSPYKIKQLRYSRHIMNLISKGKASDAGQVFEQMMKSGIKAEVAVYNTLIAGYGRQRSVRESFKIFNQMKKHGLTPTDHTYTSMLSACAETGPKAEPILQKLESEIERKNIRLNSIGTNAHISALASCRRQEDALKAYLDMTKVGVTPNLHTYSGLLTASAKDRAGGMLVAQRVWQEMGATGCEPDLYSYNLLLQCLRDAGLEGSQTFSQSDFRRVPPVKLEFDKTKKENRKSDRIHTTEDSINENGEESAQTIPRLSSTHSSKVHRTESFHFLLNKTQKLMLNFGHVAKSGAQRESHHVKESPIRWLDDNSVELLFESLKDAHINPDIRLFHLLLHLVLNPGRVFKHMADCGVAPDDRVILTAVKVQTRLGNTKGARTILSYSKSQSVEVGQAGYQAVATSCNRERQGLDLLDEIKASGGVPNEHVFGTLIGNALRSRSYEYVTSLLKRMRHFEVLPDDSILEMLETAANSKPKSPSHVRRHNGFKGYYSIWKKLMGSHDGDSSEQF